MNSKFVFAGTPEFAVTHLRALCEAGHDIALVLTQPDSQVGRGRKFQSTPVKAYAQSKGIDVLQPESLRSNEAVSARLKAIRPDFMVVVAYGLMIPPSILQLPLHGCLNVHGSLLPRWRGAAPVQRAIEAQDQETGVCVMKMDEGLDTGPVLLSMRRTLVGDETSESLLADLSHIGAKALLEFLGQPDKYPPQPQSSTGVTYAHKIKKEEKIIDWTMMADQIEAKIRALMPWPGVWGCKGDFEFRIIKAQSHRTLGQRFTEAQPGEVLQVDMHGILVQCGQGQALSILELQAKGAKSMLVRDFLNGRPNQFKKGDTLNRSMDTEK